MIQPLGVILSKFYELKLPALIKNDPEHCWNIEIELESIDEFVVLSNPTHRLLPRLSEQNSIHRAFWNVTLAPNKEFAVYFGPQNLKNYTIQIPDANMRLYNVVPNMEYVSAQDAQHLLENAHDSLFKMKKLAVQSEMQNSMTTCFFVIDRSDSMKGSPIQLLKKTLKVILHDFAPYCRDFHILSFGSSFEHYNSARNLSGFKDIQETIKWVETIEADMGGSDLLKALEYIDGLPSSGNPKIAIILTDGDITEPHQIQWGYYFVVGIGEASKSRIKIRSYKRRSGVEFVVDHKDFGDQEIFNMLHKLNPIYLECAWTFSTTDDHYQNQPFFKSNRYWYPFSKEDVDEVYFSSNTNLKICDGHEYWDSCQYGLTSLFSEEDSLFEVHTKSPNDIWQTLMYVDKIKKLQDVWGCCEGCDEDHAAQIQEEFIDLSVQHQIFSSFWTSLVLQTKSDVCNAHSYGFFDLSKFNKPPQPSQDGPLIFDIPKDYIPFYPIQNAQKHTDDAVPNQKGSIDL